MPLNVPPELPHAFLGGKRAAQWCSTVQYSGTVQWCGTVVRYSAVQWCSTVVQYSAVQWCSTVVQYSGVQWCSTVQYSAVQYSGAVQWCSTVQYSVQWCYRRLFDVPNVRANIDFQCFPASGETDNERLGRRDPP